MKIFSTIIVMSSLILCATAQAGGLFLYETSTTDVGLSSAGVAARAQDASVIVVNPAGLANVSGQSFSGHLINLYGDTTLDTSIGGDAGNTIGYQLLGSAYYSQQMNEKLTLGIGMYGNYGLAMEYDNLFSAVDIPSATTKVVTFQPSASYRINDQWSVGASLGVHYGMFELEANSSIPEINIDVEDTDVQVNGRVGLLYEFNQGTRLGLSYTNETEFEFKDKDFAGGSLIPQQVAFSAYHELNNKLAVMGNLNWQEWSEYESFMKAETQDTYQIALGIQYKVNSKITWNAGTAFDSSMYENQSNGDLTVPTGDAYRLGTGIDYMLDDASTVSVAFEVARMESSESIIEGNVAGFDNPTLYFLSFGYNWKSH